MQDLDNTGLDLLPQLRAAMCVWGSFVGEALLGTRSGPTILPFSIFNITRGSESCFGKLSKSTSTIRLHVVTRRDNNSPAEWSFQGNNYGGSH